MTEHADQITDHVIHSDRLGPGTHPAWRDHRRQVLDQLASDLPGQTLITDNDPSAQHRHWDAAATKQSFDLPPAA
jgi:hypothetical protein